MNSNYSNELALAIRAAGEAGRLIREKINRHEVTEFKSCPSDLVTEIDRLAEELITRMISEQYPLHVVVGEEQHSGRSTEIAHHPMTWYVDPLDGTTNFVFGLPFCSVSIALSHNGVPVLGVVHDPFREETFTAMRGGGARLNGVPISVDSLIFSLGHSLLVTGYPGNIGMRPRMHRVNLQQVINRSNNLRALGSAALELAYVACGRFTGFWEVALRPWDVAAGMVLVQEAGGKVTDLAGRPLALTEYMDIAASNGLIHREFINCLEWEEKDYE